jgi:hypothetical protein
VGASSGFLGFFMRTVVRLFLKHQYRDKSLMEEVIGAIVQYLAGEADRKVPGAARIGISPHPTGIFHVFL